MLRITIELVPQGDEARAKVIGMGVIVNNGTGTKIHGNYEVAFSTDRHSGMVGGSVNNFDRLDRNAWVLLLEALQSVPIENLENKKL